MALTYQEEKQLLELKHNHKKEILPELLRFFQTEGKKGKDQTIRPAWCLNPKWSKPNAKQHEWVSLYRIKKNIEIKEPRYKVGDICKVYYRQRTSPKGSWFCGDCGGLIGVVDHPIMDKIEALCDGMKEHLECGNTTAFPKLMGLVKVSEVFKIEMWKDNFEEIPKIKIFDVYEEGIPYPGELTLMIGHKWTEKLAKKDGFKSAEEMFQFFDKTYDLNTPKPFWAYRYGFVRSYL